MTNQNAQPSLSDYTRHTHSVNTSCSYEVQFVYIRINGLLEDVELL